MRTLLRSRSRHILSKLGSVLRVFPGAQRPCRGEWNLRMLQNWVTARKIRRIKIFETMPGCGWDIKMCEGRCLSHAGVPGSARSRVLSVFPQSTSRSASFPPSPCLLSRLSVRLRTHLYVANKGILGLIYHFDTVARPLKSCVLLQHSVQDSG